MSLLKSFVARLEGKKTFIVAVLIAVLNAALAFGYITLTPEQLVALNGVLGALGLSALRAGISKSK